MQVKYLILAPHLTYPLRNGGDLLIERKWSLFSRHVGRVDIIGMNVMRKYQDGQLVEEIFFCNQNRGKKSAGFRSVLKRSHYLLEKYMTPDYLAEARRALLTVRYDVLVCSLITTAWPIMNMGIELPSKVLIETQNDEIKWYRNIRLQSRRLPEKMSALISEQWLIKNLYKFEDCLFIHVSEDDDSGYRKILPKHKSIIIPVGTDEELPLDFDSKNDISIDTFALIFAGSLSTQINYDALRHFENRYYPAINDKYRNRINIIVAGSNPTSDIRAICSKNGWSLHENVSDEKMRDLYQQSLFSILPFSYVNGGKLKLLKSLSLGIPFLACASLSGQLDTDSYPCLISDKPEDWVMRIESAMSQGIDPEERSALIGLAKQYSWSRLAELMLEKLELQYRSDTPV